MSSVFLTLVKDREGYIIILGIINNNLLISFLPITNLLGVNKMCPISL